MRTNVYIDGFNFYYGCVKDKDTPYKWLDFSRLLAKLLPPNEILVTKYFTARVEGRDGDPDQPTRQETYLRALRTLSNFQIIFGQFLTNEVSLPRADGSGFARVLRTEEKGSDVNLATHLVHDAHTAGIECVVVVSNDSDLAEPIRLVGEDLGLVVGVISPTFRPGRHASRQLMAHAHFVKRVREGVLRDSQFPDPVAGPTGPIFKPASW